MPSFLRYNVMSLLSIINLRKGYMNQPYLAFQCFDARCACVLFTARRCCAVGEALYSLGLSKAAVGLLAAQAKLRTSPDGPLLSPTGKLDCCAQLAVVLDRPSYAFADSCAVAPVDSPVLFEDPFLLALAKPAPLLVHGDGTGALTLTDMAVAHLRDSGFPTLPQALQRLDVGTTGVVLFSKLPEFQSAFDALVSGKSIVKRYLAVVEGTFPQRDLVVDLPIGRDRHDARRMRVAPRTGQPSVTRFERVAVTPDGRATLMAATLETGRRHQIRVHLAARGHPVMNDRLYGTAQRADDVLMLHAFQESFVHPITGENVCVNAGWPKRFSAWFDPVYIDG